jgi:chromosome segregation ATPase
VAVQIASHKKSQATLVKKIEEINIEIEEAESRVKFASANLRYIKTEAEVINLQEYVNIKNQVDSNVALLSDFKEQRAKLRFNHDKLAEILPGLEEFRLKLKDQKTSPHMAKVFEFPQ